MRRKVFRVARVSRVLRAGELRPIRRNLSLRAFYGKQSINRFHPLVPGYPLGQSTLGTWVHSLFPKSFYVNKQASIIFVNALAKCGVAKR